MATNFWIDLPVITVTSEPLPSNAATASNQLVEIADLDLIKANQTNGLQVTSVSNFPTLYPVTQSTSPWVVSGTVTANIGTTNGLALDSSLSTINTSIATTNTKLTTINTTLGSPFQAGGSIGNTSFIANAGTNLNTSALALDASITTLNTSVNTLLKPASTLAALTSITNPVTVNQGTNPWLVNQPDRTTSGTISANGQSVSTSVSGMGSIAVQITGTWVGTITFQATVNGSDFNNWFGFKESSGLIVSTTTSNDLFLFPTQGIQSFKVISTAWTSGSASIAIGLNQSVGDPFTTGSFLNSTGLLGVSLDGANTVTQGTRAAASGAWPAYLTNSTGSANVTLTGNSLNANITNSLTVSGSGNFTVVQPTGTNLHAVIDSGSTTTVTQTTGTNLHTVVDSVTGTVTVTGAVNIGNTVNVTSTTLALDSSVNGLLQLQSVASTNVKGPMVQGVVGTSSPSFTNGNTNPLSLTTAGALRTDSSAVTQPISGSVTVVQATASSLNAQVVGSVASAATDSGNPVKIGGIFNTTQPTVTTGQRVDAQMTARGAQIIAKGVDGFTIDNTAFTANAGTNLNTSALNLETTQQSVLTSVQLIDNLPLTQASATSGQQGVLTLGAVTTNAPTYTTGQTDPISMDVSGNTRVSLKDTPTNTNPITVQGNTTNNNAAPGATHVAILSAVANAALPSYSEGNMVIPTTDLAGNQRVYSHPPNALGFYEVVNTSGGYASLAAGAPLFSMRWGDATRFAIILRVSVMVVTSATATTAGIQQRDLIIARGFTASDTGGTAVTLTGNNQKRRTSQGTSLVTDMRFGNPLSAGTRTLDARPVASAYGWSGLLSTGYVIGGTGSSAVGAARSTEGAVGWVDLLNAVNGQDYPITLAQNEGVIVRIGGDNAQPAGATNQTFVKILWGEVTGF